MTSNSAGTVFDDTMRIGRVMDLLNRSRVQEGFERQVVADAPQQIERRVGELIDWLIEEDLRNWQHVTARLATRRQQYAGQVVANPESERFHFDRRRMIDSVGREAQRVVEGYDRRGKPASSPTPPATPLRRRPPSGQVRSVLAPS